MTDPTADSGESGGDGGATLVERLDGGPVGGTSLLSLGSAILVWQVLAAFDGLSGLAASSLGLTAVVGVGSLAGIALVAQHRPDYSTAAGIASVLVGTTAVTVLLVSAGEVSTPDRLFLGLLVSSAGGALCIGWRPGGTATRLRGRPGLVRAGRLAVVVGLAGIVVVNAGPAAVSAVTVDTTTRMQSSTDTFPQSLNQSGGFVVAASELDAGYYDYDPDCGTLGAECPNLTTDTSRRDAVEVARLRLDNRHGNDLLAEDFLIYKDFYLTEDLKDEYIENETLSGLVDAIHFRMAADRAVATGTDDGRALDVYASEVHIQQMEARFDLVDWIDWDPRLDTIENYWSCAPDEAEGWGSINDDRLGVSADPRVTNGRNIQQLTHQLGSTETVLYDFELEIGTGAIGGMETGMEAPSDCP